MKKSLQKIAAIFIIAFSIANSLHAHSVITNDDCGPIPDNSKYLHIPSSGQYQPYIVASYGTVGVEAKVLKALPTCLEPPPSIPGQFTITNGIGEFTCKGNFNLSTYQYVSAPVNISIKTTYVGGSGFERNYTVELLQMDVAGGNLPPGVMFRENPLLQSLGQTTITDIGGGQYQIESYIDAYTELSIDGGSNWYPDANGIGRMDLVDQSSFASIPTLGTWGLIALAVLMFGVGLYFFRLRFV